jgi:hypothetical protein
VIDTGWTLARHHVRQLGALLGYTSRRVAAGDRHVDLDGDKVRTTIRQATEMPDRGPPLKSEVLVENEPVPSEALC